MHLPYHAYHCNLQQFHSSVPALTRSGGTLIVVSSFIIPQSQQDTRLLERTNERTNWFLSFPQRCPIHSRNLRINRHYAPELRFRDPRLNLDCARLFIRRHPAHEPHVIQRLRGIQSEPEGPENKGRVYEYRAVSNELSSEDDV